MGLSDEMYGILCQRLSFKFFNTFLYNCIGIEVQSTKVCLLENCCANVLFSLVNYEWFLHFVGNNYFT